ncbi:2639_t:CDS:10 [Funneliformis mosseae]|uniref:2639_t:CDS:1 n=1 Tax=Funneliformis mosseae TaxID=27381 RepID=A0A9N8V6T0_FUNMO|nr:2639_t:CDS:10 [Funneliformis mosseae]
MGITYSANGRRLPALKGRKGSKKDHNLPDELVFEEANFAWQHGRRVLDETDSLFDQGSEETHQVFKYILGGNTRTPITPEMQGCLHLGTGHFIWLIEMANEHQGVRFEGFGMINPSDLTELPPNVNLTSGDLLKKLPYPNASFDYVNVRCLLTLLPSKQIPFALSEIIRICKTNARIEFLEVDIFIKNAGPYYENCLGNIWRQICKEKDYNPINSAHLTNILLKRGLVEVNCSRLSIPLGEYGGKVGVMNAKQFINSSNAIAANLKMTHDEMQEYLLGCVDEFNRHQSYHNAFLICARKG